MENAFALICPPQKKIKSSRKARKCSREEAVPPERKESSSVAGQSQVPLGVHWPQRKQQEEQREKHQRAASSRAPELQQRMDATREGGVPGRKKKKKKSFWGFDIQ